MKPYLTEVQGNWAKFYKGFAYTLSLHKAGYFDERPLLVTGLTQLLVIFALPFLLVQSWWALLLLPFTFLGWGRLYIRLPFRTGIQDCEPPEYGIKYHGDCVWIHYGKKYKCFHMPWEWRFYKCWELCENGKFVEHIGHKSPPNVKKTKHKFFDKINGVTVDVEVKIRRLEHRRRGLYWTILFASRSTCAMVEFSEEVGQGKGSWKGGTLATGITMKPNETIEQALKRLEDTI